MGGTFKFEFLSPKYSSTGSQLLMGWSINRAKLPCAQPETDALSNKTNKTRAPVISGSAPPVSQVTAFCQKWPLAFLLAGPDARIRAFLKSSVKRSASIAAPLSVPNRRLWGWCPFASTSSTIQPCRARLNSSWLCRITRNLTMTVWYRRHLARPRYNFVY